MSRERIVRSARRFLGARENRAGTPAREVDRVPVHLQQFTRGGILAAPPGPPTAQPCSGIQFAGSDVTRAPAEFSALIASRSAFLGPLTTVATQKDI